MKKLLVILMIIVSTHTAYAADTANIKIKINGALHSNTYFLCLPRVGCLSIHAATKGRVYSVFRPIIMDKMFIADVDHEFHLSPQGLPDSCNVIVQPSQTIIIYGNIVPGPNNSVHVNQLRCSVP